jgi:putative peptidoglycan lipid II flippase
MYALGIVGSSIAKILAQAFFAMGDTRTPMKVAVGAMAFNCTLAFLLAPSLAHVGLALAIAAASTLNAVVLMVIIRRRLPGKPIPGARRAWFRVVGVSAGLFVLLTVLSRFAPAAPSRFQEAVWLAAVIIGATAAYVACNAALGSDEVRLAWGALAGRWRRSSLRRGKRR